MCLSLQPSVHRKVLVTLPILGQDPWGRQEGLSPGTLPALIQQLSHMHVGCEQLRPSQPLPQTHCLSLRDMADAWAAAVSLWVWAGAHALLSPKGTAVPVMEGVMEGVNTFIRTHG